MALRIKHWAIGGLMAASMAATLAVTAADAPAQKTPVKREDPAAKETKETKKAAATFEVYKDKAGEYRWRLKVANGQNIASSGQGYKDKRDCLAAVDSVKRNAADAKVDVQDVQTTK